MPHGHHRTLSRIQHLPYDFLCLEFKPYSINYNIRARGVRNIAPPLPCRKPCRAEQILPRVCRSGLYSLLVNSSYKIVSHISELAIYRFAVCTQYVRSNILIIPPRGQIEQRDVCRGVRIRALREYSISRYPKHTRHRAVR